MYAPLAPYPTQTYRSPLSRSDPRPLRAPRPHPYLREAYRTLPPSFVPDHRTDVPCRIVTIHPTAPPLHIQSIVPPPSAPDDDPFASDDGAVPILLTMPAMAPRPRPRRRARGGEVCVVRRPRRTSISSTATVRTAEGGPPPTPTPFEPTSPPSPSSHVVSPVRHLSVLGVLVDPPTSIRTHNHTRPSQPASGWVENRIIPRRRLRRQKRIGRRFDSPCRSQR